MTPAYHNILLDTLRQFKNENRLRSIPDTGEKIIYNLTSNDYLGLSRRTDLVEEFLSESGNIPFSSSASRLLSSQQEHFHALENFISARYGKDVLLFNSGYHANVGTVSALSRPEFRFLADRLSHASIIDGLILGKADFKRWKHNDVDNLYPLVKTAVEDGKIPVVIAESIYSMDGDYAPLKQLTELKSIFPSMMIYLDEAHAFGVENGDGFGLASQLGVADKIDILIGTFGKALCSTGAFVATSPIICQYLLNTARSFIFSTALPPVNAAWTLFLLKKSLMMNDLRLNLKRISVRFREGLENLFQKPMVSDSQIIPLLTGNAEKALEIATKLKQEGVLALPIRRPTVPPGGERIRFSLSADMSEDNIDEILEKIKRVI